MFKASNETSTTSFNVCFKISDIMFFITNIKNPTSSFKITSHISFSNSCTRSNGLKLSHNTSFNNKQHHFYFNQIYRLWNSLPIHMDLPTITIKNQIKLFFWNHFIANFNPTDSHKLHYNLMLIVILS